MADVTDSRTTGRTSGDGLTARVTGALSGAAFVVLILVGNTLYVEGGQQTLGLAIELLGFVAAACFIAYAAAASREATGWVPRLAVVGGVSMVAIKVGSLAPILAARQPGVTPEVAGALIELNSGGFVASWFPHGLFVVGVAAAGLVSCRLPRVVAWLGIGIGAACTAMVAMPGTEPLVVPYLLSLLWIIVASILLARGELRAGRAWTVGV
jgi:hypothetical protein